MKIKAQTEFLTFNDGTVSIFETDENDSVIFQSKTDYRFGNRRIGFTRYYAARQNDIELDKVIHIHLNRELTTEHAAVIENTRYKIEKVEFDSGSNPPVTILSLSQRGVWRGEADDL